MNLAERSDATKRTITTALELFFVALVVGLLTESPASALGDRDDGRLGIFRDRDPRVVYSVPVQERVAALTLDDGPDPETTPLLLELLRNNGARATFFLITDQIPGNEHIVRRIVSEGHELGNHMVHDEPSIELPPHEFEARMLEARSILERFAPVVWFRPASGYYDDAMLEILSRHGLRCVLGSVYFFDAQLPWSWPSRLWIRWRTRPGAVIILHDGGGRGHRTLKTLGKALPDLRAKGYRLATLSELWALRDRSNAGARGPLHSPVGRKAPVRIGSDP